LKKFQELDTEGIKHQVIADSITPEQVAATSDPMLKEMARPTRIPAQRASPLKAGRPLPRMPRASESKHSNPTPCIDCDVEQENVWQDHASPI